MHPLIAGIIFAAEIPVSFDAARAKAVEGAPEVRIARRKIDVAAAHVDEAGALENPTLALQSARETARFSAEVTVPIAVFGQRGKNVEAAEAEREVSAIELDVVKLQALHDATIAWLDLWEAQKRGEYLSVAATEAGAFKDIAQERFDAGTGPLVDVVRLSADRERARAETLASDANVRAASARLAPWIAAEGDVFALRASGEPALSRKIPEVGALERALEDHPELRRARAELAATSAKVDAERRMRWPLLVPKLAVDAFDPTLEGVDVIFGVAFDVPILSLRGGAIDRGAAEREVANTALVAGADRARAELFDAHERASGAAARVHALETDVLPLITRAKDMTEQGFKDGRIDVLRVLEAERATLELRVALLEATSELFRALADLERSMGAQGAVVHAP